MLELLEITKDNLTKAKCESIYKWRFTHYRDKFKTSFVPSFEEHEEFMKQEICDDMIHWFALVTDLEMVGCFSIKLTEWEINKRTCTIGRVMIEPQRRRQKLGETLLKKGIDKLVKDKKIKRFELEVLRANIAAIKLYQRCGFTISKLNEETIDMELKV